jgi:outer membrane receptor protein involved in Fe transport
LKEVSVVFNGYQTLPKERATGSFTQIDNNLLNRSVSTNILDRLNGVTSGLIFTDNGNHQFGQANIEVRGRATLFSNPDPLIIMDNFPYDGNVSNINPNDIESITILKDAAAASVME